MSDKNALGVEKTPEELKAQIERLTIRLMDPKEQFVNVSNVIGLVSDDYRALGLDVPEGVKKLFAQAANREAHSMAQLKQAEASSETSLSAYNGATVPVQTTPVAISSASSKSRE